MIAKLLKLNNNLYLTLSLSIVLLLILLVTKHISMFVPFGPDIAFILVCGYQLYTPLYISQKYNLSLRAMGIHTHGMFRFLNMSKFNKASFLGDLKLTLLITFATLILFSAGFHVFINFKNYIFENNSLIFKPYLSLELIIFFFTNLLAVALPEEIFYRGFLQSQLLKSMSFSKTSFIIAILFSLGHFIGEYDFLRLTTFFPSFIFSYLAFKNKSIAGATFYHAFCNTLMLFLSNSYFLSH